MDCTKRLTIALLIQSAINGMSDGEREAFLIRVILDLVEQTK